MKVFKNFSIRSNYDNICDFISTYMNWFGCPTQLEQHGLSCTCSFYTFNTSNINLPPSVFHVKQLDSSLQWLATVSSDVLNRIEVDPKTVFNCKSWNVAWILYSRIRWRKTIFIKTRAWSWNSWIKPRMSIYSSPEPKERGMIYITLCIHCIKTNIFCVMSPLTNGLV